MGLLLLLSGIIVILVGVLLILSPKTIQKFNDYMNTVIFKEKDLYSHNISTAVILILIGLWFCYIYFRYM